MKEKEKYKEIEIEVIIFNNEDVIITSGEGEEIGDGGDA